MVKLCLIKIGILCLLSLESPSTEARFKMCQYSSDQCTSVPLSCSWESRTLWNKQYLDAVYSELISLDGLKRPLSLLYLGKNNHTAHEHTAVFLAVLMIFVVVQTHRSLQPVPYSQAHTYKNKLTGTGVIYINAYLPSACACGRAVTWLQGEWWSIE